MNKTETIQVITLLASNYDSIARKDKSQKQFMVNSWTACLNDLKYDDVLVAVKNIMIKSSFPPTIADIRKNLEVKALPESYQYRCLYKNLEWCEMNLNEY